MQSWGLFCIFITTASRVSGKHTNILVVVGKYVCNSRKVDLGCGLTCVFQHRLPAALGAIFLPPCLYNTNIEATQKFKIIISKAYSGSLFMDLFQPIFHAVLHCIPVSCQLGKWMGCKPSPTVQPTQPATLGFQLLFAFFILQFALCSSKSPTLLYLVRVFTCWPVYYKLGKKVIHGANIGFYLSSVQNDGAFIDSQNGLSLKTS